MPLNPQSGLLASLIDYAGLFPPAALELPEAAANYARYRQSARAAMLGRFVVPVAQLPALARWIRQNEPHGTLWEVSVLVGKDVAGGFEKITITLAEHVESPVVAVRSIEAVATTPEAMHVALPPDAEAFFEIDHRVDPSTWIRAAAAAGVAAKIRTGGVEQSAFPSAGEIARFILACARHRLPFKATAGLHHPFPAAYPLTYEADSPLGTMHGFMNVFYAAAMAWRGSTDSDALCSILESTERPGWDEARQELNWTDHRLSMADLAECRENFARSYGSCSFLEPIEGLEEVGLL
ncbi:MAG: hypothetical protein AAF657_37550 [Acidobacteriota bacterium]